jgi:type IX secretion system PorP/SprF family membrane protein
MKPFYISFLLAITVSLGVVAQTRPQPSMYIFNYSFINPAAIGVEDYSQVRTGYRRQWIGIDGAPATAWLNGEIRLGKEQSQDSLAISKGSGVGVNIYQDEIGPYKTINLNLGYAYHLPLSQSLTLSAGFAGGLHRTQYDMSKSVYPDQAADPAAIAQASTSKKYSPDLNAGIMLNGKSFFAGVSVMQMLPTTFVDVAGSEAKLKQQFLGMLGYNFTLDEEGSALLLSGVVKSDFADPVRYDVNARVRYQTLGFVGASYRKDDALGLNLGLNLTKSISVGYMYEWGIDKRISTYAKGNHEFCLGFRFLKANQSNQSKMGW